MRTLLVQVFRYATLSVLMASAVPALANAQSQAQSQTGVRYLNWAGKTPQNSTVTAPMAAPKPASPTPIVPQPQPKPQPQATYTPVVPVEKEPVAVVAPPKPAPTVAPAPAPAPAPAAASDSAYQVPATSKYAQRLANARAAQGIPPVVTMAPIPNQEPAPKPAAATEQATAPDMSAPLSAEQTDHVFIPGETITNDSTQRPRFYSLHRQYGITPDAIDVPQGDNTGLLEAPYDTQSEGDNAEGTHDSQP